MICLVLVGNTTRSITNPLQIELKENIDHHSFAFLNKNCMYLNLSYCIKRVVQLVQTMSCIVLYENTDNKHDSFLISKVKFYFECFV